MKLCWEATGGAPGSCVRGPLTACTHTKSPLDHSTGFLFKSHFLFIISFVFFSADSTLSLISLIVLRNCSVPGEFLVDRFMFLPVFG